MFPYVVGYSVMSREITFPEIWTHKIGIYVASLYVCLLLLLLLLLLFELRKSSLYFQKTIYLAYIS